MITLELLLLAMMATNSLSYMNPTKQQHHSRNNNLKNRKNGLNFKSFPIIAMPQTSTSTRTESAPVTIVEEDRDADDDVNVKEAEIIAKLYSKALECHKEKKMAQAVATFDELLLISPLYQDAIFERALCLSQMGYVNEAVEGFQNALEIKMSEKDHAFNENDDDNGDSDGSNQRPGREEIYLANILLEGRGDKQAALDIYQRCGSNSALVTVAGVCLDSLGRHDEAKKCYEQGLELVGGDADFETMIHKCINLYRSEQKLTQEEKKYSDNNSSSNSSRSSSIEEIMTKVESSTSSHIASSWEYISNQPKVWSFPSVHYFTHDMVQLAMQNTSLENGLILEFGVYYGKTIRMMAEYFPNDVIHGFDTFEGLPGDWFNTKQGSYSTDGTLPSVPDNVNFYKGLFSETLPDFLANQPSELPIRLMNIDCDMYASTKDVFDLVHNQVKPGTIIIFDEYIQNPNWKEDEYKAFQEAVERFGWKYEYIAISMTSQQAIVRIL